MCDRKEKIIMIGTERMTGIDPVRLNSDSKFSFRCHKDIRCFTQCCRGTNITLTPYDIILLKNRLQLSSEEFLAIYTEPHMLEKTDLPIVTLRHMDDADKADKDKDDEERPCVFVRDEGCLIYSDRPTACRYYPVGTASLAHKEGADDEDFYFFVSEPHCLGFEEDKEWTVQKWREDQGVDIHDEINAEWTDLLVRKRSFPPNIKLTDKSKQMFFLVSYNIDKFRKFVFESTFLTRYEVDPETLGKIREDEVGLLKFGIQWLRDVLFKEGDFKVREK